MRDKVKCWEKIKEEFNGTTLEGTRDIQTLKIFYQNSKRTLKKERAEKNKDAYITILQNTLDNRNGDEREDETLADIQSIYISVEQYTPEEHAGELGIKEELKRMENVEKA
ncbi:uncharacterized protein LOC114344506 [Diabrotica virgifera virgifera]|uniref:Regulatory protein zeste n=1 Tax=Diabrotica virgifera virgifera TaxID=50390 RepID=A0ABM5IZ49_DIAVI|nr:uncharacterized protein LOC114344506 [Diabrotica virgifera virgifera]